MAIFVSQDGLPLAKLLGILPIIAEKKDIIVLHITARAVDATPEQLRFIITNRCC